MLRHSITQPLERHKDWSENFETEPYECAWASEGIFFIRVQEMEGERGVLRVKAQISPDGIHWVDEGTCFEPIEGLGTSFLRVREFGGWLRLKGEVSMGASFNVMVHLVLK